MNHTPRFDQVDLPGRAASLNRDLRSRKVQVRFDRRNFERAIVYYKGERMGEARQLDRVANDRPPSKSRRKS